jgi:DNA polymerase-3 subunit alpha
VYGTIAYQTAYLKANYPHEYMTAVLSSAGTHERIAEAVAECVRNGIAVLLPDVNLSGIGFQLEEREGSMAIRFGLETVKNVGWGAAENIVAARSEGGAFTSVDDFAKRVDLKTINKRALESLIKAGALDALGGRGTLLANVDRIVSLAQREQKLKETGQSTMFDMFGDSVATPLPAIELTPQGDVPKAELLSWERELLGVYVSEHPFRGAAIKLAEHTSALVSELTAEMDGRDVIIAGMVNDTRVRTTKAGKPFLVVTAEDLSGTQELTVWSDVYEPTKELWQPGNILLMLVKVRERGDRLQISVNQVTLVQAADGSLSHETFEIPSWLTSAVRESAGVGVVSVEHEGPSNGGGNGAAPPSLEATPKASSHGNGNGASAAPQRALLRFYLHESDDTEADRRRLDELVALIERFPGTDVVRLFVHAHDGDKIELSMPAARVCDELRDAGIALLADAGGGAEPIMQVKAAPPRKTRGVEPLEV